VKLLPVLVASGGLYWLSKHRVEIKLEVILEIHRDLRDRRLQHAAFGVQRGSGSPVQWRNSFDIEAANLI
jgi:hypothetical protein